VRAPAPRLAGLDRTHEAVARRESAERVSARDGNRHIDVAIDAGTELTRVVRAPAECFAGDRDAARLVVAGTHARERSAVIHAHRNGRLPDGLRAVTELAARVVAPAPGSALLIHGAAVRMARADRHERDVGRNLDRLCRAGERPVTQLALVIVTPAP